MHWRLRLGFLSLVLVGVGLAARADVKTYGEISGVVQSADDKTVLPGASVTLTGAGLIQKSITVTSGPNGSFRFQNLNPGDYTVTVAMPGFGSQQIAVTASVGKTANVPVFLQLAKTSEALTVQGEAPLIDKTSPQLTTTYTSKLLDELPTTRNYIDVIESAPTVTDRSAFGAGGQTEGYDIFGFGAATNSYSLNGVMVNALEFGNTWVNPNYDTIAEIQLVGPGASSEYANYTGAAVNIVTKAGTNEFHGGGSAWYTSDKLTATNDGGIADLKQNVVKDKWEGAINVGGPIFKEKLLFFASAAYYTSATAAFADPNQPPHDYLYNDNKRQSYQLRLDYLLNSQNTISGMYNRDPILEKNDGLLPCCSPDIAFTRDWNTNTGVLSWQSVWGTNTSTEAKYAAVNGHNYRIPVASLDIPGVTDVRVGYKQYNSTGFVRYQANNRHEGIGTLTHYVDNFLGASHELKGGVEYEYAQTGTVLHEGGNMFIYIFSYSATQSYIDIGVNYNNNQHSQLKRPGAFINDNLRFGSHLTANLGVRFDHPDYIDQNTGKSLLTFTNWSPRVGLSYDFAGDGKTVAHASYGRYYEKVPTYGPGYYAGTGNTPITYYAVITDAPVDPTNWQAIVDLVVRPENITQVFTSQAVPVIGDPKNPLSDVFSASLERQVGPRTAVSLSFVAKDEKNYLGLLNTNNPQFEFFPVTTNLTNLPADLVNPSQFNGLHPPLWNVVGDSPDQQAFGNIGYLFQHQRLLTLEVRSNPIERLRLNGSVTYENNRGNHDNNECAVLSLCTNYKADNPNFSENPYVLGEMPAAHKWQVKAYGYYNFPLDISLGASYRYLSGTPWGASTYSYRIPGFKPAGGFQYVLLEPKDARHQPGASLLDLQLSKSVRVGPAVVTALASVTNVLNTGYQAFDYYNNDPYGVYTYQRNPDGTPASSFGKPQNFMSGPPRVTRFGLRVTF
jgi:outer membrane receptor protein involved in Fe transport